jgi:hypothetical protein
MPEGRIFPGLLLERVHAMVFRSGSSSPQTLGSRHYSDAALRNAADFLVAICFPSTP